MPPTYTIVGKKLLQARRELGWSQEMLAEKAKVKKKTIANWESGRASIRAHASSFANIVGALRTEKAKRSPGEELLQIPCQSDQDCERERLPHQKIEVQSRSATGIDRPTCFGVVIPYREETDLFRDFCIRLKVLCRKFPGFELHGLEYSTNTPDAAVEVCRRLADKFEVSGVFYAPFELFPTAVNENMKVVNALDELLGLKGKIVLLDRDLCFPGKSHLDVVQLDNINAGRFLADYVVSKIAKPLPQILFVQKELSASSVYLRFDGVNAALNRCGITSIKEPVQGNPADIAFVRALNLDCDAIICANDDAANDLTKTIKALNLSREPLIAGFDGLRLDYSWVTIQQPTAHLARVAWELMRMRVAEGDSCPPITVLIAPNRILDGYTKTTVPVPTLRTSQQSSFR